MSCIFQIQGIALKDNETEHVLLSWNYLKYLYIVLKELIFPFLGEKTAEKSYW